MEHAYQELQSSDLQQANKNGKQTSSQYNENTVVEDEITDHQNVFDFDAILDELNKMEDLNELENVFRKINSDMQKKTESRKIVEEENAEMRMTIKSSKCFSQEIQNLHSFEAQTVMDLRDTIEATRMELAQIEAQQVDNLNQFENDVQEISHKFMNGPRLYTSSSSMEKVLELKKNLEEKMNEFSQYKEYLEVAEGRLQQCWNIDEKGKSLAAKVFDESLEEINTLNTNLTKSVEQISNRIDSMRFEMRVSSM